MNVPKKTGRIPAVARASLAQSARRARELAVESRFTVLEEGRG
jgi:hypothetical protein